MHLPIVLCCGTQRPLFTKIIRRLVPNHWTLPVYKVLCMYVLRLLSTGACMSYCNVWAEVFWFSKKRDVYTNFTMPIFCVSPNSITSLSLRCWFIPVSEIRKFNRK